MYVELSAGVFGLVFAVLAGLASVYWLLLKLFDWIRPQWALAVRQQQFTIVLSLLIFLLASLILAPIILIKIDSGHAGVLWKRFGGGTVLGEPFNEGTVLTFPWDHLTIYNMRFQTEEISVDAVTSEGLKIKLNVVVRYRPVRTVLPMLHKLVGRNYPDVMVIPEVGSSSRLIVSDYTAEEVYGKYRQEVQVKIYDNVNTSLRLNERKLLMDIGIKEMSKFVHLEDILIRDVVLPQKVNKAIVNKVNQKYLDEEYITRLEVAKKEALRKQTEAEGIAAFQATVAGGISETYLRWRGIEATIELAKSNNAKVVVIGGGKDGLPLILNTEGALKAPLVGKNQLEETKQIEVPVVYSPDAVSRPDPVANNVEIDTSAYLVEKRN